MIEFCRIFHAEKSILANLGYLIFKIFWGSNGKYLKIYSFYSEIPDLYKPLLRPPPENFEIWLLWHFFKLYALICYIRINSVLPLPNYLRCDN